MSKLFLTRVVPARTKTVVFTWIRNPFMTMDDQYRAIRAMLSDTMAECFWCRYMFKNGDVMALAAIRGKRNQVLCQNCATAAGAGNGEQQ